VLVKEEREKRWELVPWEKKQREKRWVLVLD
jgi:hypothetical protein